MNQHKIFQIIILAFLLVHSQFLFAGKEHFVAVSTSTLTTGTVVKLEDDKFQYMQNNAGWNTEFLNTKVLNRLSFYLDPGCANVYNTFTASASCNVTYYTAANVMKNFTCSLNLSYNPAAGFTSKDLDMMTFEGGHKVTVQLSILTTGTLSVPSCLKFKNEILVDRYYYMNNSSAAAPTVNATLINSGSEIQFAWNYVQGAEEYDLEWLFVDDYQDTSGGYFAASSIVYDFNRQTTRISTGFNFYVIPHVFEHGYLLYRIRAVGRHSSAISQRYEAEWSTTSDSGLVSAFADRLALTTPHQSDDFNWSYVANYAEQGKRQEQVSYMDGTLKTRQSVGKAQSINQTIVQETFYDYQGRPAVFTLPAPTGDDELRFYTNFNRDGSNTEYTAADFDKDTSLSIGDYEMSDDYGASKYYSAKNTNKEAQQAYLPKANEFPMARVQYANDLTGRIDKQSGFGDDHKLASGHETRYFYADPPQQNLDRLFGTDVGYSKNYKEVAVMDPNGQISSSYLDQQGRVIATFLAGNTPDNLRELSANAGPALDTTTLLDLNELDTNGLNQPVLTVVRSHMVKDSGLFTFDYAFETQVFRDSCLPSTMCLECTYDLHISVKNAAGTELIPGGAINTTIGTYPFDLDCGDSVAFDSNFYFPMDVGTYTITKTLTINTDIISDYVEAYVDSANCLLTYEDFLTTALDTIDFSGCDNTASSLACLDSLGSLAQFIANGGTQSAYDSLFALCMGYELGYDDPCDIGLQRMMMNVSPGGQYAEYLDTNLALNPGVFPLSILNDSNLLPDGSAYWRNPLIPYTSGSGSLDSITYNGVKYPPGHDSISLGLFINAFKPSWAKSLVGYHPEYCYYDWCTLNGASHEWDQEFLSAASFTVAKHRGFLNPVGSGTADGKPSSVPVNTSAATQDPFFATGGQGAAFQASMRNKLEFFWVFDTAVYTIWEAATIMAYCPNVTDSFQANTCVSTNSPFGTDTCDNDILWAFFRNGYINLKNYYYDSLEMDHAITNGCYNGCVGEGTVPLASWLKVGDLCNDTTSEYYGYKSSVWGGYFTPENHDTAAWANALNYDTSCAFYCSGYADAWFMALEYCGIDSADSVQLRDHMINICKLGCDQNNPYGSSSIAPDTFYLVGADTVRSFEDLFNTSAFSGLLYDSCSPWMIVAPLAYGTNAPPTLDTCGCKLVLQNEYSWDTLTSIPAGVNNATDYFYSINGFYPGNYNKLVCVCTDGFDAGGTGPWSPGDLWNPTATTAIANANQSVPQGLACSDACISCSEIAVDAASFLTDAAISFGSTANDSTFYYLMFSNWLANKGGLQFSPLQLQNFMAHCDTVLSMDDTVSLCNGGYTWPTPDSISDCEEFLITVATFAAQQAYQVYLDSVRSSIHFRYLSKCTEAQNTEAFDMIGYGSCYYVTLYYYDQSGMLVKTVPPKGVDRLNNAEVQNVPSARAGSTHYRPVHSMVTEYRYNTLNGLVSQNSPDGGYTDYWYDHVGRLVLSQNARQLADDNYSYTLYDRHGRIREVGQLIDPDSVYLDSIVKSGYGFEAWIKSNTREQITRTFYDEPLASVIGGSSQQNLWLRVASTAYYDTLGCDTCYLYASHFSYDVHGNVKFMIQDIKPLQMIGHRYKLIEYEYDLISGNVTSVHYQNEETDAFHHRYFYDADNRLTEAETSPQKEIWSKDAKYFYYDHGPLARVEHGQYKVQAEDIAYTINGWIKGSNSTALDSTLDMGSDSDTGYLSWNTAIHKFIARDEVSYSLGYYSGDYTAISTVGNNWLASLTSSGLGAASSQLFNGNIGHMATNWRTGIAAQAMAYDYDQLNRLVEATAFQNLNAGTNTWSSGGALTDYHEEYAYDLNGNILTLERKGYGGTPTMDDFDYNYISNTNQLEYVGDAVSSGNYAVDIDNQSSGNYAYNEIGQLVDDNSENATYDWNVYGKIKEVGRTGSGNESALAFAYDPQGNRAYKAVKPRTSGTLSTQLDWTEEWYVRDVRGNIMAVYGSSYDSTGHPGAQACGYFRLLPDPGTIDDDIVEVYLDGNRIHSSVGWITDAETTACALAAAINSYSSTYWATCGGDTVYVCTEAEGVTHNGEAFTAGPNHNGLIGLDTFALRGGIVNTLLYHMSLDMDEHHIYGSSRLGLSSHLGTVSEVAFQATTSVQGNFDNVDVQADTNYVFANAFISANTGLTGGGTVSTRFMKEDIGLKIYEYTNHLGNVLLTTNDKRLRIDNNSDNLIDSYLADDLSKSDYYPYGMPMVGRNTNLSDYRFGYQGSEMDNEFDGSAGSHYTTYFRQLDPRLGRWMSIDPVWQPWQSPYNSMDNNPIALNDVMGDKPNPFSKKKYNVGHKGNSWSGLKKASKNAFGAVKKGVESITNAAKQVIQSRRDDSKGNQPETFDDPESSFGKGIVIKPSALHNFISALKKIPGNIIRFVKMLSPNVRTNSGGTGGDGQHNGSERHDSFWTDWQMDTDLLKDLLGMQPNNPNTKRQALPERTPHNNRTRVNDREKGMGASTSPEASDGSTELSGGNSNNVEDSRVNHPDSTDFIGYGGGRIRVHRKDSTKYGKSWMWTPKR